MSSTFSHSLIWSSSNPCIFPCPRSHDYGGEKLFFPLWTAAFLPFSHLSLTPARSQSIQGLLPPCLFFLQPLDTSGRASARGKAADAGQRRALEREAEQATVDAASPDHLEPPPCASRGASTSATRHHAGPLLSPSVLPMPRVPRAARARQCACELVAPPGARPAPSLSSWRPTPPPLTPQTSPRPLSWPPEPLPRPPVRRVHGEPRVGYLRPPPSLLSTPLALSPSRAPLDQPTPLPVPSVHRNGRSAAVGLRLNSGYPEPLLSP